MFLLVSLSKSKVFACVALVSFLQHLCRTCVALVLITSHLYRTRVTSVELVLHSCFRVTLVSLVSSTRVVN